MVIASVPVRQYSAAAANMPQRSPSKSFAPRMVYWLVPVYRGRANVLFRSAPVRQYRGFFFSVCIGYMVSCTPEAPCFIGFQYVRGLFASAQILARHFFPTQLWPDASGTFLIFCVTN
uniref:Uncharacterized protein n=1 Tax=Pseudomonas aeruginosa TaxID=287 RepID=A0A0H4P4R7_PSEAI|nr:Hypothetical protein [Pseudomonas aeruginosa]